MIPPIQIKYERTLDSRFDSIDSKDILSCFKQALKKQRINSFVFENDLTLKFQLERFWLIGNNWNKWHSIKQGSIEIRESENKRFIIYKIDVASLVFASSLYVLMGIVLAIIFKMVFPVLFFSLFAFGLVWLITWVQHDDNLTGILNELLRYKNNQSKIH